LRYSRPLKEKKPRKAMVQFVDTDMGESDFLSATGFFVRELSG
jgi:hypothetical protein